MQYLNADGNWEDIRDLVEPARRPRFPESVLDPWHRSQRANVADDFANDADGDRRRRTLPESRYREFQLVGSDGGGCAAMRMMTTTTTRAVQQPCTTASYPC
jgi:hypothetical protein